MRNALFTLTKRQLTDNAIYFAAALLFSFVLIIATISVVLTEDHTHLSSYSLALLFAGPVLFCIGSYILGLIQTRSDQTSGVAAILSVLPVPQGWILFARIVVGALVILMVLGPMAITGAILWKFLGPPAWLFHGWIADVFLSAIPTTFACYFLGLHSGGLVQTFIKGLRALLLILILLFLIIIKGFGSPLLVVLAPFAILCLLHCWKPIPCRIITNITFGLIVLILLAMPLYLGRSFCDGLLMQVLDVSAKISPSGLLPTETENDPNVEKHSTVSSSYWSKDDSIIEPLLGYDWASDLLKETFSILEPLGITEYFQSRWRGERRINLRDWQEAPIYYVHLGLWERQLIYRRTENVDWGDVWNNKFPWDWKVIVKLWAGPEGVSAVRNEELGRFEAPIIYFGSRAHPYIDFPPRCVVYDGHVKRFFSIDFQKQTVRKGPELQDSAILPFSIGSPDKSNSLHIRFDIPPHMRASYSTSKLLPVVDELGQVHTLNLDTLELQGPVGHLPQPQTPFGPASSKPKDLFDYGVEIIDVGPTQWHILPEENDLGLKIAQDKGEKYPAVITTSLSRQGMWTSVAIFDKEGNEIRTAHSKTALFDVHGGPTLTIMKYALESLHPPVLTLASYFTAYSFEARSTHRALFLMPNSFVALARDYQGNVFGTFVLVLLLMLPALLFSSLLGWRVGKDATILGLSHKARRLWLLGTFAFGLPAYITYRLTRPKITLVTCANCGKPRRLDMDRCHRCNSLWHVPELTPPDWRILDNDTMKGDQDTRESGCKGPEDQETRKNEPD